MKRKTVNYYKDSFFTYENEVYEVIYKDIRLEIYYTKDMTGIKTRHCVKAVDCRNVATGEIKYFLESKIEELKKDLELC
jgi:hypothetical protein